MAMRTGSVTSEQLRRAPSIDPSDPLFFEDGPLVGTPKVLQSPNVIEPPIGVHLQKNKIPTPSVYTDKRGEIYNLRLKDKRINLLYTRKGTMRSGDLHPNRQCTFVVEGAMELWLPQPDGSTEKQVLKAKDYVEVMPFVPHVEHFLEDTVHAEWWESSAEEHGGKADFRHWYYAPYRRLVDTSFGWGSEGGVRGTLKVLRENSFDDEDGVGNVDSVAAAKSAGSGFFAGVAIGALTVALGIWVGKGKRLQF